MSKILGTVEVSTARIGKWNTLVELLRWRAAHQPDQRAYTFLVDGETEETHLTYGELDRRARAIGAELQRLHMTGARALLLYPSGLEYIAAFFGCLYGGVVAVPVYPPNPARLDRTLPRLRGITNDAQPVFALTTSLIAAMAEPVLSKDAAFQTLRWLATDSIADSVGDSWHEPEVTGDTLAFLQYTSGATAAPRGVMVSHRNLLHNEHMIQAAFGFTEQSIGVGWLPLYHDMGLIGLVLQPLYLGFPCILMDPVAFLQKPVRWLQALSRYRGTISPAPNFAYDLCVRKVTPEQREALDLSNWQQALNGAEPVRPETLERFFHTFEPCGFRREAFYPCYGLAEATLVVSGGKKAARPAIVAFERKALERERVVVSSSKLVSNERVAVQMLVSCGKTPSDEDVIIVDPETCTQCPPERIGEIWVAGASVAEGYWNRQEETEHTFRAHLADTREGPFLRTGDLGFIHDGELFVTGRLKDLIIIRGRNHYPQDIELTVEHSHPALQPSSGAACSVDVAGEERLVIVHELKREQRNADVGEVVRAIREAVSAQHELQVYAVQLLKPSSIPRTSSGKIQRHACRAGFLAGTLDGVGAWTLEQVEKSEQQGMSTPVLGDAGERERLLAFYLRTQVARTLAVPESTIDLQQPLTSLGLDSLRAIELKYQLETELGVSLPVVSLLEGPSIAELASRILPGLNGGEKVPAVGESATHSTARPPAIQAPAQEGHVASLSPRLYMLEEVLLKGARLLWSVEKAGLEKLPSSGPFILCPNHQSAFDHFWIAACLPPMYRSRLTWVVKIEASDAILSRLLINSLASTIPIARFGDPEPALRQSLAALRARRPLVVYPEGTRSRTGQLGPFRAGAAWLALATGAPLIPVRIDGSYEILGGGRRLPRLFDWRRLRRLKVGVAFGAPLVPPAGASGREAEIALTDRLRKAVEALHSVDV